jgi:hypothetical protein
MEQQFVIHSTLLLPPGSHSNGQSSQSYFVRVLEKFQDNQLVQRHFLISALWSEIRLFCDKIKLLEKLF